MLNVSIFRINATLNLQPHYQGDSCFSSRIILSLKKNNLSLVGVFFQVWVKIDYSLMTLLFNLVLSL